MKKSEFYAKFNEFVKDWEGSNLTAYNQFANALLEFLEKEIGMAPPAFIDMPHSYNRADCTYGYEVNEWEEESD